MANHELRTPLHCMLGLLDVLQRSTLDPEQRQLAHAAVAVGRSLLDVVDDVLDLSRLEAGAMHLQREPFSPRTLVESVTSMFAEMAKARGTALMATVLDIVPERVSGDAGRIRQILVNLIGNALKFTDHGTVAIIVGGSAGSSGPFRLRFDVSDTGGGIAPDVLPRLFERYSSGDGDQRSSSGLGLAISRRFARAMDGDVTVTSTHMHGSVFTLSVPCERAVDASTAATVTPLRPSIEPLRVLLAEDNRVSQYILTRHFQDLDCTVDVVNDGIAALSAYGAARYDLVLLDCQMPVLDGAAAARAMRAVQRERRVPIIAVTSSDDGHERNRCMDAGMDDYVDKPLELSAVAAILDRWCPLS